MGFQRAPSEEEDDERSVARRARIAGGWKKVTLHSASSWAKEMARGPMTRTGL